MNKLILILSILLGTFVFVGSAHAAKPNMECLMGYGPLHKSLATSGETGNRMNSDEGHIPGIMHMGVAGFCAVDVE